MKKITEIYKDYKIMPNLAMHQMRVAAVAMQICDSLSVKINNNDVVKACLVHDMGNITKFKLDHFPKFTLSEGLEYWQDVQKEYIDKYGNNDHIANEMIARELNLEGSIIELVLSVDPKNIEENVLNKDLEKKICIYSDNRVNPHGIVSLPDRLIEVKERYQNHTHSFSDESHEFYKNNIQNIEKQIFSHSNIKPEDINDDSIKKHLDKLVDFTM